MISRDLAVALLAERFGFVPDDERHAVPPRVIQRGERFPAVDPTPDTPATVAWRQQLLNDALSDWDDPKVVTG
ncbi:hypothetical protein [Actinokineospora sp.]|uniref:hypothetical protein n=1 Tax=Actinokineospora sp. TaxID=1872133 RepID=UPI003D6C130D